MALMAKWRAVEALATAVIQTSASNNEAFEGVKEMIGTVVILVLFVAYKRATSASSSKNPRRHGDIVGDSLLRLLK